MWSKKKRGETFVNRINENSLIKIDSYRVKEPE
jgi:hypothetical protein